MKFMGMYFSWHIHTKKEASPLNQKARNNFKGLFGCVLLAHYVHAEGLHANMMHVETWDTVSYIFVAFSLYIPPAEHTCLLLRLH